MANSPVWSIRADARRDVIVHAMAEHRRIGLTAMVHRLIDHAVATREQTCLHPMEDRDGLDVGDLRIEVCLRCGRDFDTPRPLEGF